MMNRQTWIVIALGVVARLVVSWANQGWFIDDTYIYWRYARNFADGAGLVYNIGEPVLGFTSPLFMLLLAGAALLIPPSGYGAFAVAFGIVCYSGSALLLRRVLHATSVPRIGHLVAQCVLSFYFPFVDASIQGMETPLVLLLMLWFLDEVLRSRSALTLGTAAGLLVLSRPEGLLFAVAGGSYVLVRDRRLMARAVLVTAIPLIAYTAWSTHVYGSPVPNSAVAKSSSSVNAIEDLDDVALYVTCLTAGLSDSIGRRVPTTLILMSALGIALGVGLSAMRGMHQRDPLTLISSGALLLFLAFYFVGQPGRIFSWYGIPGALLTMLLLTSQVPWMKVPHRPRTVVLWTALVGLLITSATLAHFRRAQLLFDMDRRYETVSEWILRESDDGQAVATGDIGYIGWRTQRRIVDLGALVSREIAVRHSEDQNYFVEIIQDLAPTILILDSWTPEADRVKEDFMEYVAFRDRSQRLWFDDHFVRMNRELEVSMGKTVYVHRTLLEESDD